MTQAQVAEAFDTTVRTVNRFVIKSNSGKGGLAIKKRTWRPSYMNNIHFEALKNIILDQPDKTLIEYCELFNKKSGISISRSSMDRFLKKVNFRRKKKNLYAQEQDRIDVKKREDFMSALSTKDPSNFIFLDEAGANTSMVNDYGRVEGGKRLKMPKPAGHGEKFSIISAISMLGIMALTYCKDAVNGSIFMTFLKKFLLGKLCPGHIVFLDNIKFHKSGKVKAMIESVGAKLVFLPPYSPDFSPIENMWSKLKHFIKKLIPRTKEEFHLAPDFVAYAKKAL